jgi:squalene-hopene/tetraprenyl-beta-curcumene cyclase
MPRLLAFAASAALVVGSSHFVLAQEATAPATAVKAPAVDAKAYEKCIENAAAYLKETQQADGSFSRIGPAITALIVTGLIENGRPLTDPVLAKSLKNLEGFVQPTGGIHAPNSRLANYETCVIVVALKAANKDGKYDKILANADKFLKGAQLDEEEGHEKASTSFGGAGYAPGKNGRPDLSNTHYMIEALRATGNDYNSEAIQKALVFVSRCQNLESPHNTTPFAAKINDGGFYYTPAGGGEGKKKDDAGGGLRSYGSMTYAGLKSMVFAGVGPTDPRVKAATEWVQKNYDLKSNPGQGTAGLYYYYHLFAKALDAMGKDQLVDAEGRSHDWRKELLAELASRQQKNGSWANDNEKWMETDPHLATGFALMALSYCREKPADKK